MADRLFAIVILLIALGYGLSAMGVREGFMSDPLGPKAFPLLLAITASLGAVVILLKPTPASAEVWPDRKGLLQVLILAVVLFIYAMSLKPAGFIIPTFFASAVISYMISARLMPSLLTGLGLSLGLFALFKLVLNLSLTAFGRGF